MAPRSIFQGKKQSEETPNHDIGLLRHRIATLSFTIAIMQLAFCYTTVWNRELFFFFIATAS
jgi:hypothetical protein